jgi:hypothetical protein
MRFVLVDEPLYRRPHSLAITTRPDFETRPRASLEVRRGGRSRSSLPTRAVRVG